MCIISYVCSCFVLFQVFALYSYLSGKPLTPDSAFFALTIIQQTQLPLTNFSLFFESLASTTVSVNRLAAFFKHSQINKTNKQATLNTLNAIEVIHITDMKYGSTDFVSCRPDDTRSGDTAAKDHCCIIAFRPT